MMKRGMPPLMLEKRTKNKRGVSPIIATILLVAITVVIAAVLYYLVFLYTGHSTGQPISIGFGSVSAQGSGSNNWYNASVLSATPSSLHWSDIKAIIVQGSGGGPFSGTVTSITVLVASSSTVTAVYSGGTWTYTGGASSSTLINAGDVLSVRLSTTDPGGLVILTPTSTFSGSSQVTLPG